MARPRHAEWMSFPQLEGRIAEAMAPLVDRRRLFDALHALSLLDAARSDTTLAELALAHRRARESGAEPGRPPPIQLREFFERFHDHYRAEQSATRSGVRWAARILCKALGPAMPMEALSGADILAAAEPIRATRTYNGFVKLVGTALRWGNREGLVDLPFADSLKRRPEPFREPVFFAPEKGCRKSCTANETHAGTVKQT